MQDVKREEAGGVRRHVKACEGRVVAAACRNPRGSGSVGLGVWSLMSGRLRLLRLWAAAVAAAAAAVAVAVAAGLWRWQRLAGTLPWLGHVNTAGAGSPALAAPTAA